MLLLVLLLRVSANMLAMGCHTHIQIQDRTCRVICISGNNMLGQFSTDSVLVPEQLNLVTWRDCQQITIFFKNDLL